ncbi:ABC transporter permease [Pseudomonas sp. QD4]|uniref:ABC transporter permease n=1 Tax=Pseudomonas sp. QD4 TaxID=3368618 RepID=UPI003BA21A94
MKHVEPLEIRVLRPFLSLYSLALLMFLIIPILVIVPLSFNEGSFLSYPLSGLSLRWYREFFNSSDWMPALLNTYPGLVIAHAVLGVPFVVITVNATLQGYDRNFTRAAASLGATPWYGFKRVTLPLIAPGVLSGALFAFATSFDEVVVTLFLASPTQRTLPMQMFAGIKENLNPTIAAAATMMVLGALLLLLAMEALRRRNERIRGTL